MFFVSLEELIGALKEGTLSIITNFVSKGKTIDDKQH